MIMGSLGLFARRTSVLLGAKALLVVLVAFVTFASCSMFNREGPDVSCADLEDGRINACADGIIATCVNRRVVYEVCTEGVGGVEPDELCDANWQERGAYRCARSAGVTGGAAGSAGATGSGGRGGASGSGGTGGTGTGGTGASGGSAVLSVSQTEVVWDTNQDDVVSPGETGRIRIRVQNTGSSEALGVTGIAAFIALVGLAAGSGDDDKKSEGDKPSTTEPSKPSGGGDKPVTSATQPEKKNPADEFVAKLKEFNEQYSKAPNDIKKSDTFNDARKYSEDFFKVNKNQIKDWKGGITSITTPKGGGELWVKVKVGDTGLFGFAVTFQQGTGLTDKGVPKGTPVYNAVAEMKEDQCVIFSGKVDPKENSVSESGAMSGPEFNIKFSEIKSCE